MKTIGILPARYGSTRFPGKALADIHGKTMIRRVYEQCMKTRMLHKVVVATDDQRIYDHVLSFGAPCVMTRADHASGTDRCAEALSLLEDHFEVVVNIQGDEPFIEPAQIEAVIQPFFDRPEVRIATLARKIKDPADLGNPNAVKVVFDASGKALYFSRSAIPYNRGQPLEKWLESAEYYHHIGLYAFRTEVLKTVTGLPSGRLEGVESLEQLRWLEAGWPVHVNLTELESRGIDTPEDLIRILAETSG